jgi:hypothetical protein
MLAIDRMIDAERLNRRDLRAGCGADDRRAAQLRELHRRDPHPAARTIYKDGLALGDVGHPIERDQRGQVVHGNGGGLAVAQPCRHWEHEARRRHDRGRISAEFRQRHHPIAHADVRHVRPHGIDDARDFVADDERRFRGVRIQAQPRHDVGEIHARRAHGDPHVAVAGNRVRGLPDLDDLGRAVFRDHRLPHIAPL